MLLGDDVICEKQRAGSYVDQDKVVNYSYIQAPPSNPCLVIVSTFVRSDIGLHHHLYNVVVTGGRHL